jgi:hypothetical protein
MGEFEGKRLDFGFGVLEGGVQPKGFGGLFLELVEQILNGVWVPLRQAEIGFGMDAFRARIHA